MEKRQRRRELEELEREVEDLQRLSRNGSSPPELAKLREQVSELRREFFTHLGAWQRTQIARHPQRPYTLDFIRLLFTDFSELTETARLGTIRRLSAASRAFMAGRRW
jgi:acetyl-CoA carboxylase carboxyl transferase subunit alpha